MDLNNYDYIIVGAGLSGSVISRKLAEDGYKVVVLESKDVVAGHIFDEKNEINVLIQKYGPHIFHTNKQNVYDFIIKYHNWVNYKLECEVYMEGKFTPSPFNFKTIDDYFSASDGTKIKKELKSEYPTINKVSILELLGSNNKVVRSYGNFLYEKDYKLYTSKQWGIHPSKLDKSILRRVPVRLDYSSNYFDDTYQLLPEGGYHKFILSLLEHSNIDVLLNSDFLNYVSLNSKKNGFIYNSYELSKPIIYTGALDNLFGFIHGKLPYRSLVFKYEIINKKDFQNVAVTAYPQDPNFTRITEYTKLPFQDVGEKTVIAKEYPVNSDISKNLDPYYPIINEKNNALHQLYLQDSSKIKNLFLCGRLADYKYYNMDDTIESALRLYDVLSTPKRRL